MKRGSIHIGIDFDNTIICYDRVFFEVALERGLIPSTLPAHKDAVRNHLRLTEQENAWTEMQGEVYGPKIKLALPQPGVIEFLGFCKSQNFRVSIVSHKTLYPYLGPKHDLHESALSWLTNTGILGSETFGIDRSRVFLEPTQIGKIEKVTALGCSHFIDDLPELFAQPSFPDDTQKILFDPNRQHSATTRLLNFNSWGDIRDYFSR